MAPIASRGIWLEPVADLVTRWYKQLPEKTREETGTPDDLLARGSTRAGKIQAFTGLESSRPLKTAREWDARWDRKAQAERLERLLAQWGFEVVRHRGGGSFLDVSSEGLRETEGEAVFLVESELEAAAAFAHDHGLTIPYTARDVAVLTLAREVYDAATRKLGNPALPWTEELGRALFTQRVLGLPFNPLVVKVLENDSKVR